MGTKAAQIGRQEILILPEPDFHPDHVCLVTGAGTGIGRATAVAAAANNLMTVGLDVDEHEGHKTQRMARDVGGQMIFIAADPDRDDQTAHAVAEAAKLGAVKYLVNIAEIRHMDPVERFPMEMYDRMQRRLLRTPFYLCQLTIPHMRNSRGGTGVIGNLASVHAHACRPNRPVCHIVQFGLRALSRSISVEGGGRIRSFTVSTGRLATAPAPDRVPSAVRAGRQGIVPEKAAAKRIKGPSGGQGPMTPAEVANLFIFGFSRHGRYLAGGDLRCDDAAALTG